MTSSPRRTEGGLKFGLNRNFIGAQQNQSLSIPRLSSLEQIMVKDWEKMGLINKIYNQLSGESWEMLVNMLESWWEDLWENILFEE